MSERCILEALPLHTKKRVRVLAVLTGKKFTLGRVPQTRDELWWTVYALWGVKIPRQAVCPGHCAPFDAFADAFFAKDSVAIWKASRGFGGKTQLLSILGMTEITVLGAFCTILGGSGAQSMRVHETMTEAWLYSAAPSYLLSKDPTRLDTFLTNGGKARTLMASTKSVRGPHPQRMRLDEIDEMDLNVLQSAQGQPMAKKNQAGVEIATNTVMSSTHQYPEGTMTTMLRWAEENGFPIYQWCYKETSNPVDGWLRQDEIDRKKKEIPEYMWKAEYDLQEPSFKDRALDESLVAKMFDERYGVVEGGEGKYIEIEPPKADRNYITGADWAKKRDQTIIWTFDATVEPWRMVAFERISRRPWPVMVKRLNVRIDRYGGKVCHDSTGIGTVVEDYIEVPDHVRPRDIVGQTMAGRVRNDMITNYISAIEQGLIIGPRITYAFDEHRYATPDDLYNGSSTAHLPDTIAAGALAWSLRNTGVKVNAIPDLSLKRTKSPWLL